MPEQHIMNELYRLSRQKIIQSVYKSFYTVIPIQYSVRGIVPPTYYIDQLMEYLAKPYYISLLSAAEIHGAAPPAPSTLLCHDFTPRGNNICTEKQPYRLEL